MNVKQLLERIEMRLGALEQQFRERFAHHRSPNHRTAHHHGANAPDTAADHDDVIGVEAAMALTGLSKSGIYHKTCSRNGEPPELAHYKRGKRVYFRRAELLAWMTSTRVKDRAEIEATAADYMAAAYGDDAPRNGHISARSSRRVPAGSSARLPSRAQDEGPARTARTTSRSTRTGRTNTNPRRSL